MDERDNSSSEVNSRKFAMSIPYERSIQASGQERIEAMIVSTDEETARELVKYQEEQDGIKTLGFERVERGSTRSFFGFSGSWNAPWEPTGPKPTWGPPPEPNLN